MANHDLSHHRAGRFRAFIHLIRNEQRHCGGRANLQVRAAERPRSLHRSSVQERDGRRHSARSVDPNALTRLARAAAELDTAEAQRRAEEARRDELNQPQLQMESEEEPVPLAEDGYADDERWYGSFPDYRHHRRSARKDHMRLGHTSQDMSSAAFDHTVPAPR